jgi:triacylglycerol esterase/lipase EstA (alpha/beta hydrolase family)
MEPEVSLRAALERISSLVVLVAFAAHLLLVLLTFVIHFYDATLRHADSTSPLGHYMAAFVADWWNSLVYAFTFPLGYLPLTKSGGKQALDPLDPQMPVLLVHGYLLNRASMFAIFWRLRREGLRAIYTINLRPTFGPIERIAEQLAGRIGEIAEIHQQPVTVIAHSMGGLVLRRCLADNPDLPVAKGISLGTPHRGTTMAHFGVSVATAQMRPNAPFLASLGDQVPIPWVSIYSQLDNIVIPADSAAWGPRTIRFTDMGHLSLLYSPRVFQALASELTSDSRTSLPMRA